MIKILITYLPLVVLGVVSRIIPHPANFTAAGGIAIYLGQKKMSWKTGMLPILVMLTSDVWLGFDSLFMRAVVYGGIFAMYAIGRILANNLWMAGLISSLGFFLITNLGVFVSSTMYEKSLWGLTQCLYMALPFWRNALVADIVFSQVFKAGENLLAAHKKTAILSA